MPISRTDPFPERRELLIFLTPQVMLNEKSLETMLQEQTEPSLIRSQFKRDDLERRVLDPIIPEPPTDPPTAPPNPPAEVSPTVPGGKGPA